MLNIVQFLKCIKKNENFISIVLLFVFFIINCFIYWTSIIQLLYDVGREFIIPQAILDGKVLYKDILNIYGPLAFIINAFAFKFFGASFQTLNAMGALSGLIFVFSCYFLSKEFLSRKLSFLLALLICTCIFNSTLFNFLTSYSYNTVYGLTSYTLSSLFIIRYLKYGNLKDILIASCAAGFCISNKIEYYWIPLILALSALYLRPLNLKDLLKTVIAFLIFPIFSLFFLFYQGLNFADLLNALHVIKASTFVEPMLYFHKLIGIYPDKDQILSGIQPFCFLLIMLSISYIGFKHTVNKKILRVLIILFIFGLMLFHNYWLPKIFGYLPIIFTLLTFIHFKIIVKDKALLALCIIVIGASLKTYFFTNLTIYGYYTVLLLFIGVAVLFNNVLKFPVNISMNTSEKENYTAFLLILFSLIFFISHLSIRITLGYERLIGGGVNLYSLSLYNKPLNDMAVYIRENTDNNDRLIVYPEGEIINILSERKPDYLYYSLHPIFMDTFGEDNVVERIETEKIEYIIFVKGFGQTNDLFGREEKYKNFELFVKNNYDHVYTTKSVRKKDVLELYKLHR